MEAKLEKTKNLLNLLAFSGGTDSTALFFKMLEEGIQFDIILVNYQTRENSNKEEEFARSLAKKYNKKVYVKKLDFSLVSSNFEKKARDIRHSFFKEVMYKEGYVNLITGHNLNDKLEWFLMQLTKGAGTKELFGMEYETKIEVKDSLNCKIIRPLLSTPKEDILRYLDDNNLKYFYDTSNEDQKYKRNKFRKDYVRKLIKEYSSGISRTFNILEEELKEKNYNIKYILKEEELDIYLLEAVDQNFVVITDMFLKQKKYLMSGSERKELKERKELTIEINRNRYAISFVNNVLLFTRYDKVKKVMTKLL